jgi:serine/threonine protein kinase/tetratricopeptide (TPR) repeat protein
MALNPANGDEMVDDKGDPIRPDLEDAAEARTSLEDLEHTVSVDGAPAVHDNGTKHQPQEPLPEVIGPYRILGKLGEGGIGIVYEAEQQQPRRRVALKVMRGGPFVGEEQARLLQREAETLARLKHPNIGAIYEAGRTEEGQHFFAMELIRGNTLDEWLALRKGTFDSEEMRLRLRVFAKIADAVHYAHQRGVIHRDLKPSNIIVTEPVSGSGSSGSLSPLPDVKILDFGLARITDQDVPAGSMMTEFGAIKGTLPYMSPEQARGNPDEIDLRTDVYALGVVLYEMLAGRRPYEVARSALAEAIRVICEEKPRPLKETWSGVHRLNQDVETIVGKALEKDPDRRYASAASFSEDIARFLSSQPIQARPPSAGYQIKMMVARHRGTFAALVAILVAVVVASVVSTVQYLRAERESQRARTEAVKSEQVAAFLTSMLEGAGPAVARGRDATLLTEILDETSARVSDELADQPAVEAAIRSTLGVTYLDLGDLEKAEDHVLGSLQTYQELDAESADVAQSLNNMGVLRSVAGRYEEAVQYFEDALELRRRILGDTSEETADSMTDLGNALVRLGRFDEAEPLLRDALASKRALHDGPHASVALGINSLGNLLHHREAYDEAEALYREALAMHRETLGDDHPDVVVDLNNLAYLLRSRGDLEASEPMFREVLEANQRIYGPTHPKVAESLSNMGMILLARARFSEAEAYYRRALEMQRETLGEDNPDAATTLDSIGRIYRDRGDYTTARTYFRQALAMHRKTLGEEHSWVVSDLNNIAHSLMLDGRLEESEAVYREALELSLRALGENDPTTLRLRHDIAGLLQRQGDPEGAEELFRKVLEGRLATLGPAHPRVAVTQFELASLVESMGRTSEAEELFRASMEAYRGSFGPDHAATAFAACRVARFLHARGEFDQAEELLMHASGVLEETYGRDTGRGSSGRILLARTLAANGKVEEAQTILEEVVAAGPDVVGGGMYARARIYQGEILATEGRMAQAEPLFLAGYEYLEEQSGADAAESLEVAGLLADLYEAWQAADPSAGKQSDAQLWRERAS